MSFGSFCVHTTSKQDVVAGWRRDYLVLQEEANKRRNDILAQEKSDRAIPHWRSLSIVSTQVIQRFNQPNYLCAKTHRPSECVSVEARVGEECQSRTFRRTYADTHFCAGSCVKTCSGSAEPLFTLSFPLCTAVTWTEDEVIFFFFHCSTRCYEVMSGPSTLATAALLTSSSSSSSLAAEIIQKECPAVVEQTIKREKGRRRRGGKTFFLLLCCSGLSVLLFPGNHKAVLSTASVLPPGLFLWCTS